MARRGPGDRDRANRTAAGCAAIRDSISGRRGSSGLARTHWTTWTPGRGRAVPGGGGPSARASRGRRLR
ncbi:hypothetical protein AMK21_27770 [Streptomyces sp. CB00316]|nr:hypothetical protein AMK21_27770 [Streptomyces sp. CB00316]